MKQAGSQAQETVSRLILDYLGAHPLAADSAEGIGRWWLGACGAAATPEQVERALVHLVEGGLMRRVSLADGTVLYARESNGVRRS